MAMLTEWQNDALLERARRAALGPFLLPVIAPESGATLNRSVLPLPKSHVPLHQAGNRRERKLSVSGT